MPTLTTKLETVNSMLGHIGETPVNSIADTNALPVTAAMAVTIVDEVSREVQTEGWHFNTEDNVKLTPDSQGVVTIPEDIIELDVADKTVDVVQRGLSLFDRSNNTTTFSGEIIVSVIRLLDWDSLPEVARRYITLRSSRVFQGRVVGSRELESLIARDEFQARARLMNTDGNTSDRTIFDSPDVASRIGINRNYSI
jgi:hypothetical protein